METGRSPAARGALRPDIKRLLNSTAFSNGTQLLSSLLRRNCRRTPLRYPVCPQTPDSLPNAASLI
jgi:hypothetical protein